MVHRELYLGLGSWPGGWDSKIISIITSNGKFLKNQWNIKTGTMTTPVDKSTWTGEVWQALPPLLYMRSYIQAVDGHWPRRIGFLRGGAPGRFLIPSVYVCIYMYNNKEEVMKLKRTGEAGEDLERGWRWCKYSDYAWNSRNKFLIKK